MSLNKFGSLFRNWLHLVFDKLMVFFGEFIPSSLPSNDLLIFLLYTMIPPFEKDYFTKQKILFRSTLNSLFCRKDYITQYQNFLHIALKRALCKLSFHSSCYLLVADDEPLLVTQNMSVCTRLISMSYSASNNNYNLLMVIFHATVVKKKFPTSIHNFPTYNTKQYFKGEENIR